MSEKRFYYNIFYFSDDCDGSKEFEIRDRENDEWAIYIGENDSNWEDMLVELLNEQSDNIEGLILDRNRQEEKLDIARRNMTKQLEKIEELEKENEQLKNRLNNTI